MRMTAVKATPSSPPDGRKPGPSAEVNASVRLSSTTRMHPVFGYSSPSPGKAEAARTHDGVERATRLEVDLAGRDRPRPRGEPPGDQLGGRPGLPDELGRDGDGAFEDEIEVRVRGEGRHFCCSLSSWSSSSSWASRRLHSAPCASSQLPPPSSGSAAS